MITQLETSADLVVRPSGVWNSRAPFHNFLQEHREIQRSYHILTLAVYRVQREAESNESLAAKSFFNTRGRILSAKAWSGYQRTFPYRADGTRPKRTIPEACSDLYQSLYDVREGAIVRYASSFETFTQCWALNYLLAKLEAGKEWNKKEGDLAKWLSPRNRNIPGWPEIVKAIAGLRERLEALPHIFTDPETNKEVEVVKSHQLNAFRTLRFWREFRNLVIHCGGVVSKAFLRNEGLFFDELRKPYPYIETLIPMTRLKLYDDMFRAQLTVHYRAARSMNEWLEIISNGRRGHPLAPGPKPDRLSDETLAAPAPLLLIEGDHELSLNQAPIEWWLRSTAVDPQKNKIPIIELAQ